MNRSLSTWILHVNMGDTEGKMNKSMSGLEFRLEYHLYRKRGGGMEASLGAEITFGKDGCALGGVRARSDWL